MSLYHELKRRNVLRVAVAYLTSAWLVLQVGSIIFPVYGFHDRALILLITSLCIGFPLVLLFSWVFEITPEGLKREAEIEHPSVSRAETGEKLNRVIILSLSLALGFFAIDKFLLEPGRDAKLIEETALQARSEALVESYGKMSIAVLPFTDMSPERDQEHFSDGISEEILNVLARIPELRVISRSSSFNFKDKELSIPIIAERLNVAHVLEGSVRTAGNQVRITAQLIEARTDTHLWSNTYDRQLSTENLFAIQSEISTHIARALQIAMAPGGPDEFSTVPTRNMAALEAYFLGRHAMAKRTTPSLANAVEYFDESRKLDPGFFLAYAGLADCYLLQVEYSGLPMEQMLPKSRDAIDQALALNSQSGEVFASLGMISWYEKNAAGAEAAFGQAIALSPNYAPAHHWYASSVLRSSGRHEEALNHLKRSVELDPLSPIMSLGLAVTLSHTGRIDEAIAKIEQVIESEPGFALAYRTAGVTNLFLGHIDEAVAWYQKSLALDPDNHITLAYLGIANLSLGDDQKAEIWIHNSLNLDPAGYWPNLAAHLLHLFRGEDTPALDRWHKAMSGSQSSNDVVRHLKDLALSAGRASDARVLYEQSYPELFNLHEEGVNFTNFRAAINLAQVLLITGEEEKAEHLLDFSLEYIGGNPRLSNIGYGIADVSIHALRGDQQQALALLRQAIDEGWRYNWWYYMTRDPSLESIRFLPEFKAMVEEVSTDMAAQLSSLHQIENG